MLTWALLTGDVLALQRHRKWPAGMLLGLLSCKPQYLPSLGLLLGLLLSLRLLTATAYVGYSRFVKAGDAFGFQPRTICTLAIYGWLCWVAWKR